MTLNTTTPEEFFPLDRWPQALIPYPSKWRKLYCYLTGGHDWKKFLWGGVNHPFDCDCCTKCWKFLGPLPVDRPKEVFPCVWG